VCVCVYVCVVSVAIKIHDSTVNFCLSLIWFICSYSPFFMVSTTTIRTEQLNVTTDFGKTKTMTESLPLLLLKVY